MPLSTVSLILFGCVAGSLLALAAFGWLSGKAVGFLENWVKTKGTAMRKTASLKKEGVLAGDSGTGISMARLHERLSWKFGYEMGRTIFISSILMNRIVETEPGIVEALLESGLALKTSKSVPRDQAWFQVTGPGPRRMVKIFVRNISDADRVRMRLGELTDVEVLAQRPGRAKASF